MDYLYKSIKHSGISLQSGLKVFTDPTDIRKGVPVLPAQSPAAGTNIGMVADPGAVSAENAAI